MRVLTPHRPTPALPTPPRLAPASPAPERPDPIAALISAVEQQYQNALQLDHQGQLDEARHGFDAALDHLLGSNFDIPATPRLQIELDSLLDRIQALESDALAEGGLSAAVPQASPLSQILQLTFPLDSATKAKLEAASRVSLARQSVGQLPLVINDPVLRYVHYFTTRGRGDLLRGFQRSGRYRGMVDKIFTAAGIPTDLIYLAQLESGFDPKLTSSAGARGMWQFMPERAAEYGLKRNHWIDERYDPKMATQAAAQHLKSLYAEFGSWYLAMAAYNTGPRIIEEIVARTGYANYFKLYDMGALPRSWRNYVPVILAIALIAQNPRQYGVTDPDPDPAIAYDSVTSTDPEDLRLAAESARVTVADLQHLNPALLQYLVPKGYVLKLPQGTLARYQRGMKAVPPPDRVYWRLHWVKREESWRELARRYHIGEKRLWEVNHLSGAHAPPAGTPLALPYPVPRPRRKAGR
ncbi:MAG: transglycosylase SLT domain-containing protein [Terriglobales bacterium]